MVAFCWCHCFKYRLASIQFPPIHQPLPKPLPNNWLKIIAKLRENHYRSQKRWF
jgi:hypothetical protein